MVFVKKKSWFYVIGTYSKFQRNKPTFTELLQLIVRTVRERNILTRAICYIFFKYPLKVGKCKKLYP
jgi:hypothetical protein